MLSALVAVAAEGIVLLSHTPNTTHSSNGQDIDLPTDMYIDNSGVIDLANDYVANERTKHIERRHFKIRELVQDAAIRVKYIASRHNIADIFTKALDKKQFLTLRKALMNMD